MSGTQLMNRVQRYVSKVQGTDQYWYQRRQELQALMEQKGAPTFFWTVSAADNYWPDLHRLISNNPNPTNVQRYQAVINKPHITNWFFTNRLDNFIKHWLSGTLDAEWNWYRYEWQARGSVHAHGCAKLQNDPGLCDLVKKAAAGWKAKEDLPKTVDEQQQENLLQLIEEGNQAQSQAIEYADWLVTTMNNEIPDEHWRLPQPHPSAVPVQDIEDEQQDYQDMVNSVERHTRCSPAYCLKMLTGMPEPVCRFGYPKADIQQTELTFEQVGKGEDIKATLTTKRNDPRLNSHNRIMLKNWRANVDLQIIVDADACARYIAKYAAKGEPRSKQASAILKNTVEKLNDTDETTSALKRTMIQVTGERDFSSQETSHMLLGTQMYGCTFQFITVSLDNSRKIQLNDEENADQPIKRSVLDDYATREQHAGKYPEISQLNFIQYASQFYNTKQSVNRRTKPVVVRTFPNTSSDPAGAYYGTFCKFQLIKFKPWTYEQSNAWNNQEETDEVFIQEYRNFLNTPFAQQHVTNFEDELQNAQRYVSQEDDDLQEDGTDQEQQQGQEQEDWMLLCQLNQRYENEPPLPEQNFDWNEAANNFPQDLLRECPKWIINSRNEMQDTDIHTGIPEEPIDPSTLNNEQRLAYDIISSHFDNSQQLGPSPSPLRMMICGTAGTGKSYLIRALAQILSNHCLISATTGIAAFSIHGCTVHSTLQLPIQKHSELQGQSLQRLQMRLKDKKYLIIDEMSMIGQHTLAWIDRRLRQGTGNEQELFGGVTVILIGDFGQLPPVGDRPLYCPSNANPTAEHGHTLYRLFDTVVILNQIVRQAGLTDEAIMFRQLLMRIRDGLINEEDWHLMLQHTPQHVNMQDFKTAVRLFFNKDSVAKYNFQKLTDLGQPIVRINAKHSGNGAAAATSDDAGGLDPVIFLSNDSQVFLTSNLWQQVGLCNGSFGTVVEILYAQNTSPPALPIAVLVHFPNYSGPPFIPETPKLLPIPPHQFEWNTNGRKLSRLQIPLRLRYAMTIHKSQGQTLPRVVIDLGKSERAAGCSFVAISRVRSINHLVFEPMPFSRLQSISKCKNLQKRITEEQRLTELSHSVSIPN